jgi:acetoin utilization protein AcuC
MPACLYVGEALGRYGFPHGHPFGPDRQDAFTGEAGFHGLLDLAGHREPVQASREDLVLFHTEAYIDRVRELSAAGSGALDMGDTPAYPGVYEAAATVVGSVLDAVDRILAGDCPRAFIPIAGLHHARPDRAEGFCVFNDCAVAIAALRRRYGLGRVAYVDIDAHHGDGVFYAFEADPGVWIADIHQDGGSLFPGTGTAEETGTGEAAGTKLNLPLMPGAGDGAFFQAWERVEAHVAQAAPEIIILQCGVDSLAGDPLTGLSWSTRAHAHATRRLMELADHHCQGRLLALGGGGYNRANIAKGWTAVLAELAG